jgi:hypothetical protein
MINIDTHNILDYVIGAILALAPFIFGFADVPEARNVYLTLGIGLIAYSLLTNYRYSILKIIPLGFHMILDVLCGIILMIAPWMFAYRMELTSFQFALHFILGIGAVAFVAITNQTKGFVARHA